MWLCLAPRSQAKTRMDLTSKRFGRWTVLYKVGEVKESNGSIQQIWRCRCDCGTVRDLKHKTLLYGLSQSCGCLQREIASKINKRNIDLTGMQFGRWTVLYKVEDYIDENDRRFTMWHCQCICGTERDIKERNLIEGNTQSCGCLKDERKGSFNILNRRTNIYDLSHEYGIGYTNKGEMFYFDLDDYEKINKYCWVQSNGYIVAREYGSQNKNINMHRLIMNMLDNDDSNIYIDHINHNKSDNRKLNLRLVTNSQNQMNRKTPLNNTSGVIGVSWSKSKQKWRAYIEKDSKYIHLGYYDEFEDAVAARKIGEEKYYGEYSYNNSIIIAAENELQEVF